MKHTFLVMMFAAAPLLAQGSTKARTELANAIAIEEQERDLAKAEKAYRAAIDDTKLSEQAHDLAKERLGQLLKRLGRDEEAKQYATSGKGTIATLDDVTEQDAEREKALRATARELVQHYLANPGGGYQPLEKLMWVGAPAVPEIAAALTGKSANVNTVDGQALARLAGLLWYFGTPSAESHLEQLLRGGDAELRQCLVCDARQLRDPRMLRFAERWLQQEKDDDVAMQLLTTAGSDSGLLPVDTDVLMDDAARRSPSVQVWVLLSMS
ncbi:MAG TPA: hypothetical protein VFL14_15670, partial [Xanthomonadales bacterium]|nr:hypothetical protein [Xanthomonadales bacterium]